MVRRLSQRTLGDATSYASDFDAASILAQGVDFASPLAWIVDGECAGY